MPSFPESVTSARTDLSDSLYRAFVSGFAAWNVVVVVAVVTSPTVSARWSVILGVLHVVIGALCWLLRGSSRAVSLISVVLIGALVLDLQGGESLVEPAAFTTIWTMNLMMLAPVVLVRGIYGVVIGVGSVIYCTVAVRFLRPEWTGIHLSTFTTGLAMVVAGSLLARYLYRFAEVADAEAANATLARYAVSAAQSVARAAADTARTMHDTAINTLAAIASGGAATSDVELVRERCRRDATTLERLLSGHEVTTERTGLADIGAEVAGIRVVRKGASAAELARIESETPRDVLRAIRAASDEAVRNAAKHSGATSVVVTVHGAEALTVDIADDGVGFDGRITTGRGLSESVLGRSTDAGVRASIHSTVGRGTHVRLTWDKSLSGAQAGDEDLDGPSTSLADGVRRWACWTWASGVVLIGVVIEYAARPGIFTTNYIGLALVGWAAALSWWLAWARSTRSGELPVWWSCVLVALVPITFVLGYEAVKDEIHRWQALLSSPMLVILLVYRRRAALWAALVCLALTVIVLAFAAGSVNQAALVVVGAAPQAGVFAGWVIFHRIVGDVAEQGESARRQAAASRLELAARQAVFAARGRWQAADAERALDLLRLLATGASDPRDPVIRQLCAHEEKSLRQIMQLSPEAVHLGPWLARALSDARERGVELAVRTGDVDAPSAEGAAVIGRILVDRVAAEPVGASMTVGVFGGEDGYGRLLMVGRAVLAISGGLPAGWRLRSQRLMDQELIEVVWPLDVFAWGVSIGDGAPNGVINAQPDGVSTGGA